MFPCDRILRCLPPEQAMLESFRTASILKNHSSTTQGFSLVELLVAIALIVALAGVLVPLGKGMLVRSQSVNCSQNLRQIGVATMTYAGDNQMTLPVTTHQRKKGGKSWRLTLQPYTASSLTFKCHEDGDLARDFTYVINDFLTPNPSGAPDMNYSVLAKIERPEATFLFAEAATSFSNDHFHFTDYAGSKIPAAVFEHQVAAGVHGGKANYLFADGHVETLSREEIRARLRAEGSRFVDPSAR